MGKEILKYNFIAIVGDFGKSRSTDALKRWIESNGGRFVTKIDENTTHLICSHEAWKKQVAMVTAARRYKKIKIVTYDWLEDSLQTHSRKREGQYLVKKIVKLNQKNKAGSKAKERQTLKKEGTSKNPSFADSALAFLEQHKRDFESKACKHKPAVEKYKSYNPDPEDVEVEIDRTDQEEGDKVEEGEEDEDIRDGLDTEAEASTKDTETKNKRASAPVRRADTSGQASASASVSHHTLASPKQPRPAPLSAAKRCSAALTSTKASLNPTTKKTATKKLNSTLSASKSLPSKPLSNPLPIPPPQITRKPAPANLDTTPANHHIYVDPTGLHYIITLVRISLTSNSNERYILKLYESHTVPHTYALHQRYVKPRASPVEETLADVGASWEETFMVFRRVFKEKVKRDWEKRNEEGLVYVAEGEEKPFIYVRPNGQEGRKLGQGMKRPAVTAGVVVG